MPDQILKMQNLSTRMFLPSWWVRAYKFAILELPEQNRFENFKKASIAPHMSVLELNSLAQMISYIQNEVLKGSGKSIEIVTEELEMEIQGNRKTRVEAFESTLSKLGGMRILQNSSGQELEYQSLFKKEKWFKNQNQTNLVLDFDFGAIEKFIGYYSPYQFWQKAQSNIKIEYLKELREDNAPLSLWKSIWLDLSGAEQALLLNLEEKMQWQEDWLHLEGVFDIDLLQLFENIKLPSSKKFSTGFQQKIHVLKKLGRKLVEHGFLAHELTTDFLVYGHEIQKNYLNLTWQVAPERIYTEEASLNVVRVGKFFAEQNFLDENLDWIDWLGLGVDSRYLEKMKSELVPALRQHIQKKSFSEKDFFILNKNCIVSYIEVFIEWNLRTQPGHRFPLPEELRDSIAGKFAFSASQGFSYSLLESFIEELVDNPSYLDAINRVPMYSLVSVPSFFDSNVFQWSHDRANRLSSESIGVYVSTNIQKRSISDSSEHSASIQTNLTSAQIDESKKQALKSILLPDQQLVEDRTSIANRIAKNQMRKTAADELKKIQQSSPEIYANLKRQFMESLDENQRRVIEGVKSQMPYTSFEMHLKKQLLEFMVHNPASWTISSVHNQKK